MMARFHLKPEARSDFEAAVQRLVDALTRKPVRGVYYTVVRESSSTYLGLLALENGLENPLPSFPEGKAFLESIASWSTQPPERSEPSLVGMYRGAS